MKKICEKPSVGKQVRLELAATGLEKLNVVSGIKANKKPG